MHDPPPRRRLDLAGVLRRPFVGMMVFAAALYCVGLHQGDLRIDGAIYGFISKRMAVTGDWLNTYYDWGDTHYFNKPPLQFWVTAAFFKVFGVSTWAAKLSAIVFALACVALTYRIARLRHSRELSALAGVALVTSIIFLRNTSGLRLDAALTFCFLVAALASLRVLDAPRGLRRHWLLLGFACGLGMMIKGGVVLLAPAILGVTLLWLGRWRELVGLGPVLAAEVAVAIAAPWHLYQYWNWGDEFTRIYFGREIFSRFGGEEFRASPFYFYALELATYHWPWLAFAAIGVWRFVKTRGGRPAPRAAFLMVWLVLCLVAVHLTVRKFDRYLTPYFPLLAIIAAIGLYATPLRRGWRRIVLPNLAVASLVGFAVVTIFQVHTRRVSMPELLEAAPVINHAVARAAGTDPPLIYFLDPGEPRLQTRCKLLFYTEARYTIVADVEALADVPPGQFVLVTAHSAARAEAILPPHVPIVSGKDWSFYATLDSWSPQRSP